jgi:uncharacterized protein (DUF2141 family)
MNMLSIILITITTWFSTPATSLLTIEVTNLRSSQGVVRLAIFSDERGFPDEAKLATQLLEAKINNKKASVIVENLKPGTYAIALLHDENGNGKMDTNLVGLPKEGYGASRDAKGFMGPPKFEDASFELKEGSTKLSIKMQYF